MAQDILHLVTRHPALPEAWTGSAPRSLAALVAVQQAVVAPDATLDSVMNAVVHGAQEVLPDAEGAVIELVDGPDLVYRAASGKLQMHLGTRVPIEGSLAGRCLQDGAPLYCRDAWNDARVNEAACRKMDIRSMIVVPVPHRGRMIGVLKVHAPQAEAFSEQDLLVVQLFVTAIAAGFGTMAEAAALDALRESEARFARAMRGSNEGIWDWDIAGGTIYYSPRFKALLGYSEAEIGSTLEDWATLLHPDDVAATWQKVQANFQNREPYIAEYRLRTKSGDYLWVESRGQTEWDAEGTPIRMSGALADISGRKQLETLKEEFVYTVTHELRSPLTALKGALDVMAYLHGKDLPEKAREMLNLANHGSERMLTLINDLLDVGRMESGQMHYELKDADLRELLAQAIEENRLYAHTKHLRYTLAMPDGPVSLCVDRMRFLQIMANLLSNAAKFSRQDGDIRLSAVMNEARVTISVTDCGAGIPASLQAHLFNRFSAAQRDNGTGLGLSITKHMVEQMGGEIRFDSVVGEGTRFDVTFPRQCALPAERS